MNLDENSVDIIVPFYPTEKGYVKLEKLKQSLKDVDPGFPYNLIIAEGKQSAIKNRNLGLRKSSTRYWLGCDDDVVFLQKGWLKTAIDKIKSDPTIGAVGFRTVNEKKETTNTGRILINKDGKRYNIDTRELKEKLEDGTMIQFDVEKDRIINLVPGCCMLFDRLIAGYFPERLYPGKINCDDNDYLMTIQANGFNVFYFGSIIVQHDYNDYEEKKKMYDLSNFDAINHQIFAERWKLISK